MAPILDSMIPSRRREQKRLREEENRLRERYGDTSISAPNDGCWIYSEHTPELEWASPSTQGFASPDLSSTASNFGEQVIIVDTETEPVAQTYQEESEKNGLTFTIPLPWASRKGNSRSPPLPQSRSPPILQSRSPPLPQSRSPTFEPPPRSHTSPPSHASPPSSEVGFIYKPTSDQYMRDLGELSRGNSPVNVAAVAPAYRHVSPPPSLVELPLRQASPPMASFSTMSSFSRRAPSPPMDKQEEGPNISAIMLLSPVSEDFPSQPKPAGSTFSRAESTFSKANSSFSRAGSLAGSASHFSRAPSAAPERPLLAALSSHPPAPTTDAWDVGSTVSRATGISDASYYTAITHHTTRSTARGPGLAYTGTMRSASRDRGPGRRAASTEPSRRRPMATEEPLTMRRQPSFDDFQSCVGSSYTSSRVGRYRAESEFADGASDVSSAYRKPSISRTGSTTGGGYYGAMVDEYRNITFDLSKAPAARAPDSESLVGRVSKATKEKLSRTRAATVSAVTTSSKGDKDIVSDADDLFG